MDYDFGDPESVILTVVGLFIAGSITIWTLTKARTQGVSLIDNVVAMIPGLGPAVSSGSDNTAPVGGS